MKLNTTDPLKAHSMIGAKGWQLATLPDNHPHNAIALYQHGEDLAFLLQYQAHFRLQEVAHCDCCGALGQCRDIV